MFLGVWILLVLLAAPAYAQSPYVAAAVAADISRVDAVESFGAPDGRLDGEAVSWSLRLGTAITDRWGVELGFTRPSTIESELQQGPIPLAIAGAAGAGLAGAISADLAGRGTSSLIAPIIAFTTRFERRQTTLDTVAWVSQRAGSRVELVYLAGLAFSRITETVEYSFNGRIAGLIVPTRTRMTDYGVGPVAGMDARLALTEHVSIVPGIRLYAIGGEGRGGWLIRPAAGLAWRF